MSELTDRLRAEIKDHMKAHDGAKPVKLIVTEEERVQLRAERMEYGRSPISNELTEEYLKDDVMRFETVIVTTEWRERRNPDNHDMFITVASATCRAICKKCDWQSRTTDRVGFAIRAAEIHVGKHWTPEDIWLKLG